MALIKMMANDGTTEIVDIKVPVQYSVVPAVTGATVELATGATTVAITVDPDFASIADATASMTDGLNAAIEAGVADPYKIPVLSNFAVAGGYLEPATLYAIDGLTIL